MQAKGYLEEDFEEAFFPNNESQLLRMKGWNLKALALAFYGASRTLKALGNRGVAAGPKKFDAHKIGRR